MRQSLDMQIRRRSDGLVLGTPRIFADPEDAKELIQHLVQHARELGRHDASQRWVSQYEGVVSVVGKPWITPFTVADLSRGV